MMTVAELMEHKVIAGARASRDSVMARFPDPEDRLTEIGCLYKKIALLADGAPNDIMMQALFLLLHELACTSLVEPPEESRN